MVYNQAAAWAAMIFKLEHLGCTWQVMLFFHFYFTFKIIGTSASDSPACRFLFYLPDAAYFAFKRSFVPALNFSLLL